MTTTPDFYRKALAELAAGEPWVYRSEQSGDYDGIEWLGDPADKPSHSEIEAKAEVLRLEWESLDYARLRAAEYPDYREYLDGIVKNDFDQIQAYVEACLAVKAKYPKPQ
jgi:hypothetical protein